MRLHSAFVFPAISVTSLALVALTPGCTQRGGDTEPDSAIPMPDAAMLGDAGDAGGTVHPDTGIDAHVGTDGGGNSCGATDLHSDIGASVAHGATTGMSNRHTPGCSDGSGGPDAWFTWTAPAGGQYVIETNASDYDTVLDVLMGCNGSSLACDDDSGPGATSNLTVTVGNGQTIVIVVDGYDGDGNYVLGIHHYAAEVCDDHVDNDSDGATDCADSDCATIPACIEVCTDHVDNDGDGDIDCIDSDCWDDPACIETVCDDGMDNDGDGDTDCADADCDGAANCIESICDDGVDNDGDGAIDCQDFDCNGMPACDESMHCADGVDNDGDGRIDCADGDCAGIGTCPPPESNCNNGLDDDGNGDIDCGDGACQSAGACNENDMTLCMNGSDDDTDGLVDCADMQCSCSSACPPATAPNTTCPDANIASMVGMGVYHGTIAPYGCGARADSTCGNGGNGGEIEVAWTAPAAGTYVFDTHGSTFDTIVSVRTACDTTSGTELGCNDDDASTRQSSVAVDLTAGQMVVVVIDAYGVWDGGNVTLNVAAM